MLRNILHFSHLSLSDCLLHVAHVRVFSWSWFILGKQFRCNEHRKRSLNVTFFTFLRLGCDSKLMNESHKKVQVVVILNHGTKGPCPHTGDGDTGAQWPVVAIQRSGAALVWWGWPWQRCKTQAGHHIILHYPAIVPMSSPVCARDHWPMVPTWPRLRWLAPGSELKQRHSAAASSCCLIGCGRGHALAWLEWREFMLICE